MKKIIIFLVVIIGLFIGVSYLTNVQNEEKTSEGNPYGKKDLHPETIAQLDDPNYQNLILPGELEKMLDKNEDITVYFYSSTCPHCKVATPILAPLAKEMDINLQQFNLQEFDSGWDEYQLESTPTVVQFKKGKEVARIVGAQEKAVYEDWLNESTR